MRIPRLVLLGILGLGSLGLGAQDDVAQKSALTSKPLVGDEAVPPVRIAGFSPLRFESIAVGSFPITLFYIGFGFDLAAFFIHDRNSQYAPWPFKSPQAPALSDDEKKVRLSAAVFLSLAVALVDALLLPRARSARGGEGNEVVFPQPLDGPALHAIDPAPSQQQGVDQGGGKNQDGLPAPALTPRILPELDSQGSRQ